jgi:hypothetical protein
MRRALSMTIAGVSLLALAGCSIQTDRSHISTYGYEQGNIVASDGLGASLAKHPRIEPTESVAFVAESMITE